MNALLASASLRVMEIADGGKSSSVENVEAVSMNDFSAWIVGILKDLISFVETVAAPLLIFIFSLSAIILVLGVFSGSRSMRSSGAGGLICGIIAFLIVQNSDAVISVLEGWSHMAP